MDGDVCQVIHTYRSLIKQGKLCLWLTRNMYSRLIQGRIIHQLWLSFCFNTVGKDVISHWPYVNERTGCVNGRIHPYRCRSIVKTVLRKPSSFSHLTHHQPPMLHKVIIIFISSCIYINQRHHIHIHYVVYPKHSRTIRHILLAVVPLQEHIQHGLSVKVRPILSKPQRGKCIRTPFFIANPLHGILEVRHRI